MQITNYFFRSKTFTSRFFGIGSEKNRMLHAAGLAVSFFAIALVYTQGADAQTGYGPIIAGHSNKCMNIPNASMDDNYPVTQSTCDGSLQQSFTIIPNGVGSYYIATGHSQKCFDVPGASYNNNEQINQFECDGSPEQTFALTLIGNDFYNIVAGHSGMCLSVNGASPNDGMGITQSQCSGGHEQMFWISSMVARDPIAQAAIQQQQQQAYQQQQAAAQQPVYQQPSAQQPVQQPNSQTQQQLIAAQQEQRIRDLEQQLLDEKNAYRPPQMTFEEEMAAKGAYVIKGPLPPVVAVSIDFVVVKKVSSGMDAATSVLFQGLDTALSQAIKKVGGPGGYISVIGLKAAGITLTDQKDASVFRGNDDLLISLNNIGQWPPAWTGVDSVSVASGQTVPIQISWNLPTNRQHHIEIIERDSASPNDLLGTIIFPPNSLYPGTRTEYVLHNTDEGSLYTVMIEVSERLPDEPSGWSPASKWTNNKAYCFAAFGCS